MTAVAGLAASLDGSDGQTLCFFRICTNGYCPGCGGGRAAAALARGDLGQSWALHPWVPLLAAQLIVLAVAALRLGQTRVRRALVPLLAANAVFAVILWVVRLSTGSIPSPF